MTFVFGVLGLVMAFAGISQGSSPLVIAGMCLCIVAALSREKG